MSLASSTRVSSIGGVYASKKYHIFNTHVFENLHEEGGVQVEINNFRKKKIDDIFDYDLLLFPIHKNLHWSLYVVTNCKFIAHRTTRDPLPGYVPLI